MVIMGLDLDDRPSSRKQKLYMHNYTPVFFGLLFAARAEVEGREG